MSQHNIIQDLFRQLVDYSLQDARDIVADYLKDPEFVRHQGMPTAASIAELAVTQLLFTYPSMMVENGQLDAQRQPRDQFESKMEEAMTLMVREFISAQPSTTTIVYQCK